MCKIVHAFELNTFCFIFFVLGDRKQLPPLITENNKTYVGESVFQLPLSSTFTRFTINSQYRCNNDYYAFLGILIIVD